MTCDIDVMQLNGGGVAITLPIVDQDGNIIDVSSATTKTIYLRKPDGTTILTKTATFVTDGTDGEIQYVTVKDEIDTVGVWKVQGYVVLSNLDDHTVVSQFRVLKNLQ